MKAKKLILALIAAFALVFSFAFAACETNEPEPTQKTEYTVTFDANGGTLTGNATVKVEEGKTVSGAPTAAKEGYDFEAWYTQATDGDKITLSTYAVTADVTLYAHYTEKTVTPPAPTDRAEVTFNANGGTIDGETKFEVDENGNVMTAPEPTKEGYRFDAWYTAADGGEEIDPMFDEITEDITLYAHWIKTYVVTFNGGEGEIAGNATVTVDENSVIKGAPDASKDGSEFHGWYTAATSGDKIDLDTYRVTADITLYAHFGYYSMPVKFLLDSAKQKIGYTLEAEDSKFTVTVPEFLQQWLGNNPVETVANASGGKSLGFMTEAGKTVMFTFNAEAAGKATLYLRATSAVVQGNNGPIVDTTVSSKHIGVSINSNDIDYEGGTVRGSGEPSVYNKYWDSVLVCGFDVVKGMNTITLTVKEQAINLDCIDIKTSVVLSSANGDAASGESTLPAPPAPVVVYDKAVKVSLVVGAYDGGPAVQKAILNFGEQTISESNLTSASFSVTLGGKLGGSTDKIYLCNANGDKLAANVTTSTYVAIEYIPTFNQYGIDGGYSVFNYNQDTGVNSWKDFSTVSLAFSGTLNIGGTEYTKMGTNVSLGEKIIPTIDGIWDVTGSYTKGDITLKYASYGTDAMKNDNVKNALIIWLHGQGEGGTDPTVTLLGNKVTALSDAGIQKYFTVDGGAQGAYVLAPQSPTMWMDYDGNFNRVDATHKDSYYAEALWELIQKFVTENPDIDTNRIYIGGCSNGGFMTMQMIEKHADYFAAAFPIATPYTSTPELIEAIKDLPIWFTHAKNDTTVSIGDWKAGEGWWAPATFVGYADMNTNAIYIDLLEAGATNVYYSLFENVNNGVDYSGHYSWIWVFNDEVKYVQATQGADGADFALGDLDEKSTATVTVGEDSEASLWTWLAAQEKTATAE
ncbi:MAG: prolyl oligopeptidase family serine peptidase [Clostridia bacterium]|nr:prolyl oligopeptidase family serine peptidase [Clostridia bacterium]